MDLAERKLILAVLPARAGVNLILVDQEWGGVRQRVLARTVPAFSDPGLEIALDIEQGLREPLRAGPAVFAGAIAAATGLAVKGTAVAILSTIASVAVNSLVGFGLSLIERAIFGDGGDAFGSGPAQAQPVRQTVRQATPRQRYVYGRALVGGAFCYMQKKPPYLITQYLVAAHPCDALEAVYVNGYLAEFNDSGTVTTERFRPNGISFLEISTRLGDPDQPIDPLLAAEFPSIPTSFRQRGHTVVTLRAYYGANFDQHQSIWGTAGTFQPSFLVRGKPIHDPRISSSDPDDETTWAWSDNWALCVADWMRSPYGGRKRVDQIDYDAVAAEADLCDQPIGLSGGGAERRYTLNGGFASDQNPFDVAERMLSAAGEAAIVWRRGQAAPLADVPRQAVRTLTERDRIGPIQFKSARGRWEVLNRVRSEFIAPSRDYKSAVSPPLIDAALVTSDGQELEATVSRPFVAGIERAQRLDKITLKRSRIGRELRITTGIEQLELEAGDVVNIEFADIGQVSGTYVIRTASIGVLAGRIEFTLQEVASAAVHEWDPATEVQSTDLVEIIDTEAT